MVLKRPFLSDTGEASTLYIHCSSLSEDRASNKYDSFNEKMIL